MGFGEYHHWTYERVLNEKPNFIAYVGMGSARRSAQKTLFREWFQGKKGQCAYQRNLEKGEKLNELVEPKNDAVKTKNKKRGRGNIGEERQRIGCWVEIMRLWKSKS